VCKTMEDCDAAKLELEMAAEVFLRLGAAPDLTRLKELASNKTNSEEHTLTERELQILKLIATGRTNRAIATKLSISEKTVARHVSNIFNKLGISSRAAATAFAYQHRMV